MSSGTEVRERSDRFRETIEDSLEKSMGFTLEISRGGSFRRDSRLSKPS